MCGNWLSRNSKLEHVTLEKKGSVQPVFLQGHDKSWYPTKMNGRCRVQVMAAQQKAQWTIWQHEEFYVMFGVSVQGRTRFLTRGREDRLIVSSEEDYTPGEKVEATDPRMFMVVGDFQSNHFSLKHCDSQLNVIVNDHGYLMLSDSHEYKYNWKIPFASQEDMQQHRQ